MSVRNIKKLALHGLSAICGVLLVTGPGWGYEINDKLSIGGVMAGIYQHQAGLDAYKDTDEEDGTRKYDNLGRGTLVFQPEISFTPTQHDELFAKFGIGAGNGLIKKVKSPFIFAPWGGDVQDDYKNINGRSRDYLLTAWYKHTFSFSESHRLGVTGGIIDATDYLDENAFANDEFTQFMNQALVNAPHAFLPSYDIGGAIEWDIGNFSVKGVAMALGTNEAEGELESPYSAYFMQVGYAVDFGLGPGNYRFLVGMSSKDFPDPEGAKMERRRCAIASFDQQLGEIVGAWIRFGWQDDKAAVNYRSIYSGGLNIRGNLWGRENDNIGVGYAYLKGANRDVEKTDVLEFYGRFALNDIFSITGDIQYMKDSMKEGDSPRGWIFGLRATAEF